MNEKNNTATYKLSTKQSSRSIRNVIKRNKKTSQTNKKTSQTNKTKIMLLKNTKIDLNFNNILIYDIETVPLYPDYDLLPQDYKTILESKAKNNKTAQEVYLKEAGLNPLYSKIISISTSQIQRQSENKHRILTYSFSGNDEKKILEEFFQYIKEFNPSHLAGHNIISFDNIFIIQRALSHFLPIPNIFNVNNHKKWDLIYLDTLQIVNNYLFGKTIKLNELCLLLGVPSPKTTPVTGENVAEYYYIKKDLKSIVYYNNLDTYCTANCLLRLQGNNIVPPSNWIIIDKEFNKEETIEEQLYAIKQKIESEKSTNTNTPEKNLTILHQIFNVN